MDLERDGLIAGTACLDATVEGKYQIEEEDTVVVGCCHESSEFAGHGLVAEAAVGEAVDEATVEKYDVARALPRRQFILSLSLRDQRLKLAGAGAMPRRIPISKFVDDLKRGLGNHGVSRATQRLNQSGLARMWRACQDDEAAQDAIVVFSAAA